MSRYLILLMLAVSGLRADRIFLVTANTSAFNSTSGYIDLQYNPGGADSDAGTVTITSFTGPSAYGAAATVGGASGTLPGTVSITNSGGFSDLFQAATFTSSLQFLLTFGGDAVNSPNLSALSGSSFAFALYANDQTTLLLPGGPVSGLPLVVNVGPRGGIVLGEAVSEITFTEVNVPEPAYLTSVAGLLACALVAVRRRRL